MEPKAFDALAISVADGTTSRRGLVARLGLGGLAASLAVAGIGVSRVDRAAAASAFTCDFSIQANVRLGPSAGDILDGGTTPGQVSGLLSVGVDADGDIASGSLKLANGKKLAVVGRSEGREFGSPHLHGRRSRPGWIRARGQPDFRVQRRRRWFADRSSAW